VPRLDEIHKTKSYSNARCGKRKCGDKSTPPHPTEGSDIPHFHCSNHDCGKNQGYDHHENYSQKNATGGLNDLIDPPVQRGLKRLGRRGTGNKSENKTKDQSGENLRSL
jgi:hypothetical protein